jgi:hypothetical protein
MLRETNIVLGEWCLVRITIMRPDKVIDIFRMFYSNSKEFCKYCRTKSLLSFLFEFTISNCRKHIFYVTTQKRYESDDIVKLAYLWSRKRIIDIIIDIIISIIDIIIDIMRDYLWCCRPERRHRNVATTWKLLLKFSCVQIKNCVKFLLFMSAH